MKRRSLELSVNKILIKLLMIAVITVTKLTITLITVIKLIIAVITDKVNNFLTFS